MADCSELGQLINDMALNLATEPNIKTIDDIVARLNQDIPVTRDHVIESLVLANKSKKSKINDLSKKLNDIKNQARSEYRLKNKITELQKHLKNANLPTTKERKQPTEIISKLRTVRNDLKKQLNKSEPAVRKRLEKSIDDLNKRIEEGIELPVKPPLPKRSKELQRLEFERDRLRRKINQEIRNLKPKTIFEHVAEPFNSARALMTSFDFSAVFRQGGFTVLGNPVRGLKSLPDMFKAFSSERKEREIFEAIMDRENAPLYAKSKLYLSDPDSSLTKKEEKFMSRWAEKIPFVAGSGRAYTTFLNKIRADSFDAMVSTLAKNGTPTLDETKAIANFINVATGRGSLGQFEQSALLLNTVFFAPKYAVSRFQLALGQPLYRGSAKTRKAIAKEYAKFVIGLGVVYALASFNDEIEIEWDPRSANFGKIRLGRTRIDPLAGISQVTVLLSRLAIGETKSSISGQVTRIRGDVPYGRSNSFDVIARFLRGKLSPMFGKAIDVLSGENVIGEEVTPGKTVLDLTIPLSMREIGESIQEHGIPKGVALGLLSIFGMGLQTYGPKKSKKIQ